MSGSRKLDGHKFPFNYRVTDDSLSIKSKLGSSKVGRATGADNIRLHDVQCALDSLLAKHGGAGRSRLSVTYALGLFAVAEDAVSLSGNVAPLLEQCLQLLLDCVFSTEMTVIGTQMMHSGSTSVTRAPWFEVCKDLQFELGRQQDGENVENADTKSPGHDDASRNNVLVQLSVAKEVIQTANEQQHRLQLDGCYVRCITHMMQYIHTGLWREERRSHLQAPLFK
jgi:hypothetical protein